MNFLQAVKVFEINVLRQSGVSILPSQLGLKSDPVADMQALNANSAFGTLLGKITGTTTTSVAGAYTLPAPPTPPADVTDQAAMLKYQQQLLTYNQTSQLYNQRMMQALMNQMQTIQQTAMQARNSASSSSSGSSSDTDALGIGGIL
jgi:hypothetical protein